MRMPGMDGADLLQHAKERHPGVARIVLSGHAERVAMVKALAVAHQFLSKPCDADTLRATLERTCALQDLMRQDSVRRLVGQLDRLPSAPRSYWELSKALTRPDVQPRVIASIIERDSAMLVKVLQLVNSPYFGLPRHIVSIEQAVKDLGVDLLRGLTLGAHVFSAMPPVAVPEFSLEELQQHAQLTARLARSFLGNSGRADEAFAAAMVHDVGQIVLALGMPAQFLEVRREAHATGRPIEEIETDLLGVTHASVGAYLLGMWGLPFSIVEAVAYHHTPSVVKGGTRDVLAALHVSDTYANAARLAELGPETDAKLDLLFIEDAGLTGRLPEWLAIAEQSSTIVEDPLHIMARS
jgi:HD-like signal output (HDOD) protein